ncbi:MAG TPA: glycosyltransferase family 4 protein [Solirubrobacteraceae bacterium]|jgi:glycosyltransferase involved in cell wall biosynthesis
MILFLHNRYRTTGGEERVVEDLLWLVSELLDEPAELISRDSLATGRARAAVSLLAGGSAAHEVAEAVRSTGARILHAHNLHPLFGWRSLAAAKAAGAKVVLHLHQYRLVCAVGVCFTAGQECLRCHRRNTLPGVLHNCRGSRGEALTYAAALALWQRRMLAQADAVVVPSRFAAARLRELGAPLPQDVHVIPPPLRTLSDVDAPLPRDGYALIVGRLAAEKGVEVAIDACAAVGRELVVAGDGPLMEDLRGRASRAGVGYAQRHERASHVQVRFTGTVSSEELARLRAGAALALVPSRSAETFGIAAAEAMAAGLPVLASDVGALPELVEADGLVPPGDPQALAAGIERRWGDREAGARGRGRVAEVCAPQAVAASLGELYQRLRAA